MNLLPLLKQYFGYDTFRPLQEEIIAASLAGRDALAVLPTGAGKSLCFQLPALARPGLTLVVSPLIALMKDQVDSLRASGVPATFLNSSLEAIEVRHRVSGLNAGEYKLLYAAPERVMLPGFIDDLRRWKTECVAVDEAHCISEWGHDFRPEYRQLVQLRKHLEGVPFLALTATATGRVRDDILQQLHMADAAFFLASFNRPNLTYRVEPKRNSYARLLSFVKARPRESGIVYVQSRKSAEALAQRLVEDGITALPYHAGLEQKERAANQDAYIRDKVQVVCATIAFGMGINKPDVRFVIHYDLPKNVEGYYQETGRAGRDSLPSECLLLYSAGDKWKQVGFIDEIADAKAKQIAREQLDRMVDYAEQSVCRRGALLGYFGETFNEDNCGMCDICLEPRETWDATQAAQKFLSCLYRIRQKSGFSAGMAHTTEVLTGADTEKIRRWGHAELSTYGIGKDLPRAEWAVLGRELVRMGLVSENPEHNTLELSPDGRDALKTRRKVTLTRAAAPAENDQPRLSRPAVPAGAILCDEALFDRLRTLRLKAAGERDVPPYVIFHDTVLRHMARTYPASDADFLALPGVGQRKLADFGAQFMAEITAHLEQHPRLTFSAVIEQPRMEKSRSALLTDTVVLTLRHWREGKSAAQIAGLRGVIESTIIKHLADAMEAGEKIDPTQFYSEAEAARMAAAFAENGWDSLSKVREALGGDFPYGKLHIYRAAHRRS